MGYDDQNLESMPYQSEPVKQPRGRFFYGCLFSAIALILGIVVIGGGAYWVYRKVINTAIEYTDTEPQVMPVVTMPEPERKALHEKIDTYKADLKEHKATEPLILTADDINALIDDNEKLKGRAHVEIVDDKIDSKISVPVGDVLPIAELKGRYLNGSAKVKLTVLNGVVDVRLEDVVVKGQPLPPDFAKAMQERNVVKDAVNDGGTDDVLDEIESVVVKNGTVIITPKPIKAEAPPAETPKEGEPTPEAPKEEAPKAETPPAEVPPAETPKEEPTPAPPAEPAKPDAPAQPEPETPKLAPAA